MSREIEAATICERIREAVQNYGQKRQDVGVVVMKGYDKSTIEKFNGYADEDWRAFDDALNELALLAPEPEPSEREVEALASVAAAAQLVVERRESDQEFWGSSEPALNDEECNLKAALIALAAARAARQTGGVDIRLNEEQSREFLATAEDEPPGWLKRAAARQARAGQRAEGSE